MTRFIVASVAALAAFACHAQDALRAVTKVVPESYISKAWTVGMSGGMEMRVTFWRPDVFRIEAGLKVNNADGEQSTTTVITETGQYKTVTNSSYTVEYADPRNVPTGVQMLLPGLQEDASRVRFQDGADKYTWSTTDLELSLDKARGTFSCSLADGQKVFEELEGIRLIPARKAAKEGMTESKGLGVQILASTGGTSYFGGGQQNGSFSHKGRAIDIVADSKWDEGGHPNPAPWMMARVDKGVYFGILRHTFSPGRYDFTADDVSILTHNEPRFDAFYFVGKSFNQVLNRYTEFTGRPNFIPIWGLELGDADAWMTRDQNTREPKQLENGAYVETTPDVVARNAEKYRAVDMPGGWILVNDGYGCKYMQLPWTVKALAALGFKTGLWTEGALDRIKWEVGTAGTRVQKIDVAWSGPAYQHGLNCNAAAYNGIVDNSNARAFIWTCQGWAGTQRYAVCWTGDQYGNLDLVRYHIPTVTGSGMSGQAYATTDIDGIFGGSNESYLRDLEWKCFTPAMYVMNGWSNVNKAPWSYPEPYRSFIRGWLKWKLRMTPYMYTTCREAWETGAPIVRPLAWNYPDDETALSSKVNYEMMLGRDFLVAPVYEPMSRTEGWYLKGIYLPEGVWYDYNDGRRVKGPRTIKAYRTTINTLPIFVRGGAILPMYPETLYSTQVPKDTLTFDIWPDGESSYTVYEDDGETRAYLDGEWTKQTVSVSAPPADFSGDIEVRIAGVEGNGFKGQVKERSYELWLRTGAKPSRIIVDGEELLAITAEGKAAASIYRNCPQSWYYDPDDKCGTVKVKLAKRCTRKGVSISVFAPAQRKEASLPYPDAPREIVERAAQTSAHEERLVAPMNAPDLVQQLGATYSIDVDGTWERVTGSVVCSKNTGEDAVVTFRLTTDDGTVIFERVGQKGKDAPQLVAVNIPKTAKRLTFAFTQDATAPAVGVWKDLRLVK